MHPWASTSHSKPPLYSQLQDAISSTPPSHQLLLLGDFKAKVVRQAEHGQAALNLAALDKQVHLAAVPVFGWDL